MTAAVSSASAAGPTPAPVTPANPKGALGKNEFLKLLVAQMKNQDPLNPTSGDQMAAQLAQFSSLEQLQNINATLDTQKISSNTIIDSIQTGAAMGTIGKLVVANGNGLMIGSEDPRADTVRATIGGSGGRATLNIMDGNGVIVGTRDLGVVSAGVADFPLSTAGDTLTPGRYAFTVSVTDAAGSSSNAATSVMGRVDAVTATSNGPVLMIGGLAVPFSSVTEIRN
ncbi:MAG: flagellar hook capping FlgD N-terminal domain-containing protein [bacterium]